MAKTIAQKLFIQSGHRIAVINAPESYLVDSLTDLPDNVTLIESLDGEFDLIQTFTTKQANLEAEIETLKSAMKVDAVIWVCYPKGGAKAKIETDLNRDSLHRTLANYDLTPNLQISIDDTWSALRFKRTD